MLPDRYLNGTDLLHSVAPVLKHPAMPVGNIAVCLGLKVSCVMAPTGKEENCELMDALFWLRKLGVDDLSLNGWIGGFVDHPYQQHTA